MAHNIVVSPVAPATITVPDDGDDLTAASVETPCQQLGNWIQWHYLRATGAVPFAGDLKITGTLDVSNQITIGGFGGSAIEALGDINTQGAVYAQNGALFDASIELTAGSVIAPTATIAGTVTAGGFSTAGFLAATGGVSTSGFLSGVGVSAGTSGVATTGTMYAGKGLKIRIFSGPDSDTTIIGADYDLVVAVLTSTRTYTLSATGAEGGMTIQFHNDTPASFNLNIEAGSEDCSILPGKVAEYYFHSGAWRLLNIA